MDFDLSDEQRLLQDSVGRLLADRYAFADRKAHGQQAEGHSREIWSAFADLGLLALPFPEAQGGIGGGPVETMIVMEAMGAALVLEPYFATVVLAGGLLRHHPGPLADDLIPRIAAGDLILAAALHEPQSRFALADVATAATEGPDGWSLSGAKALVLHGDGADALLVSARLSGARKDEAGIGLFLVRGDAPGLTRQGFATQDGSRAAEVTLTGAPATLIAAEALPTIRRAADEAVAALCAEAVGVLGRMQALTLDYLKTRQQFGQTLGSFQALQHRAADMFIALEQTRSLTLYATMMAASDDAAERARAVSAAKVQAGEALTRVGREAIQLHGGIGMTMEHPIGHYFKRGTMLDLTLGNAAFHFGRLAMLDGLFHEDDL